MPPIASDVRTVYELVGKDDLEKVMSAGIALFRAIRRGAVLFKDDKPLATPL